MGVPAVVVTLVVRDQPLSMITDILQALIILSHGDIGAPAILGNRDRHLDMGMMVTIMETGGLIVIIDVAGVCTILTLVESMSVRITHVLIIHGKCL